VVAKVLIKRMGEAATGRIISAKFTDAVAVAAGTVVVGALMGTPSHQHEMPWIFDG
jgi:hypothetical protein